MKRIKNETFFPDLGALKRMNGRLPRYYRRLLQIYSVLLIIIFSVVTYSFYYFRESKSEYDALLEKTNAYEKFRSEIDVIEDTMDIIVKLITQYDITKQYSAENTDSYSGLNFERIYRITVMLKKLQTDFSGYNLNIFLTRLTDGMVVSGDGSTYSLAKSGEYGGIDMISAATLLDESPEDISSAIIPSEKPADKINFVYRKNYSGQAPIYIFISFSPYENMKYVYDRKSARHYIIGGDYSAEFLKSVKNEIAEKGIDTSVRYMQPDKNSSLFYGKSDSNDNVIYVRMFEEKMPHTLLPLLLWAIVIIIASVTAASVLARYSYIPIRKIMFRMGIDSREITDEVDASEEKINSMLTSNSNMERALENKNKIILNHFLLDLLNGFVWGENVEKTAAEFSVDFIFGSCTLMILRFDDEIDEGGVISAIVEKITETKRGVCGRIHEKRAFIICGTGEDISAEMLDIIDRASSEYNTKIIVAYAATNTETGEIAKTCRMLMNGLDNRALTNRKTIITADDIFGFGENRLTYSTQSESELIKYCENGEKEKAVYCLKLILDSNYSENRDVFTSLKYAMLITVKRILSNLNISETELFENKISLSEELTGTESFSEFSNTMRDMLELICDYVSETADAENRDIGEEILAYIDNNLKDDISIADISREFGISPSYIGKILRTNYRTSFKSYLDSARVKKAKQMMDENKNILIKDVAQSLGYNNAVSFIRMFKKIEGISPGAYLKLK